jgi:hypothetical protein
VVFEFIEAAQRSWQRLKGTDFLPKVIRSVILEDDLWGIAHLHTSKVKSRRFDARAQSPRFGYSSNLLGCANRS